MTARATLPPMPDECSDCSATNQRAFFVVVERDSYRWVCGDCYDSYLALGATRMTDIPRGQGGDGSPQLDLDAIETRKDGPPGSENGLVIYLTVKEQIAALVALVRRLQQENEELTEALRAVRRVLIDDGDGAGPGAMFSMIGRHVDAALAKEVPETETP